MIQTNNELVNKLQEIFPSLNKTHLSKQIEIYKNFLEEENAKYNLTSLSNFYDEYFYCSVLNFCESMFDINNNKVLDIGSGSGIPGIALKLLYDPIELTIVESNTKKCNFLSQLVKKLNLNDVVIINNRIEDYIKNKREYFDWVIARAVAKLNILLEYSIPGLKINGHTFFLKSKNYLDEIKQSANIASLLKLNDPVVATKIYGEKTFVAIIYKKQHKNSIQFPRRYSKIIQNDSN